jgi:hypothetical protein
MSKKPDFDDCLEVLQEVPEDLSNDLSSFLGDDNVITDNWRDHWKGMPDFVQEEKKPYKKINVCFQNKEDFEAFRVLLSQPMTEKTKTIWYPAFDREKNSLFAWIEDETE